MWKAFGITFVVSTFLFVPGDARAGDWPVIWIGGDYGGPFRLSGEATVFLERDYSPPWGFIGTANVGVGGAKVGAGVFVIGDMSASSGPSYEPWFGVWHSVAVQAVCVRTWGSPLGAEPNRTLVGGEIEYSVMSMLTAHVGILAPIAGRHPGDSYVFSWGVGLRFPL